MGAKVPIFFVLLMLLALCSAKPIKRKQYKPCKNLVFYYHDTSYNGTNAAYATSSIVAAPQGANLTRLAPNPFHFGDLIVFDDPITLDNNLHSTPIGRAQGFYVYDSKKKYSSWFSFALVFNGPHHEGTITLVGADPSSMTKPRDITVTGGTGDFFMHRGIATLRGDALEGDYYFRLRVEVKFFECW